MIKDFNSSSESLKISNHLMSNSDLTYFICKDDENFCGLKKYNPLELNSRKLTVSYTTRLKFDRSKNFKSYGEVINKKLKITKRYEVKNWSQTH